MTVLAFYRLFRRVRPDIVQTQTWPCNLWARFAARCAGVPIIITTINSIETPAGRFTRWFYVALGNWLQRHTASTVFVSKYLLEREPREFKQTPFEIIPPPLDLTRFLARRECLPQIQPLSHSERCSLGIVARLSPEKGHAVAITAMRGIVEAEPNTRLIIVGAGPLESELRSQVQALGLTSQVEFTGFRSDVCGEMCRMDILLVPSYSEGSSLAAWEAMALGLPVLGSRIGALCEVLGHGAYGSLTEPGDYEGLTQAVIDMISDPESVLRKAHLAQEHVLAQDGMTHFVNSHANLYERLFATT